MKVLEDLPTGKLLPNPFTADGGYNDDVKQPAYHDTTVNLSDFREVLQKGLHRANIDPVTRNNLWLILNELRNHAGILRIEVEELI